MPRMSGWQPINTGACISADQQYYRFSGLLLPEDLQQLQTLQLRTPICCQNLPWRVSVAWSVIVGRESLFSSCRTLGHHPGCATMAWECIRKVLPPATGQIRIGCNKWAVCIVCSIKLSGVSDQDIRQLWIRWKVEEVPLQRRVKLHGRKSRSRGCCASFSAQI